jgi:hypothetical protein
MEVGEKSAPFAVTNILTSAGVWDGMEQRRSEFVMYFAGMSVFVVASSNLHARDLEFLKFSPTIVTRF